MTHARALLTIALGLALVSPAVAKKPKNGVFGVINGKRFKARSNGTPEDGCVFGTLGPTGAFKLTAGECRGNKTKTPKKKFAQVIFVCGATDTAETPPFEAECQAAVYAEAHIEGNQASDLKVWASSVTFPLGTDGNPVRQSAIHLRVDSFDGTVAAGVFSGAFDLPQAPTVGTAAIKGKVRFRFPVRPSH